MGIRVDNTAYLSTWADELAARASRVRNLIGTAHWPSDGAYKEHLLREIITRHVPNFIQTSRGFVRPLLDSNACSPEIDILVADPTRHVPMFSEGALQVVVPSAVLATIEVKSTYSPAILQDALGATTQVRSVALTGRKPSDLWSAILITDAGNHFSVANFTEVIERTIASTDTQTTPRVLPPYEQVSLFPHCIAVHGGALALTAPSTSNTLILRVFDCPGLALPLALAHLFAHVQSATRNDSMPGELDDLLRSVDFEGRQLNKTIKLTGGQ